MTLKRLKKSKNANFMKNKNMSKHELFKEGFIAGIGWAFGVTIGFVLISVLLVTVLRSLGGLPIIGRWIAAIVDVTLNQLSARTPGLR